MSVTAVVEGAVVVAGWVVVAGALISGSKKRPSAPGAGVGVVLRGGRHRGRDQRQGDTAEAKRACTACDHDGHVLLEEWG